MFRLSIGLLEKIGPFFMVDAASKGGLGLSNEQLGIVYGTWGLAAVLLGSLLGGVFVARRGLRRTLFMLCCAVNIPNVTFLLLSVCLPTDVVAIAAGEFAFLIGLPCKSGVGGGIVAVVPDHLSLCV